MHSSDSRILSMVSSCFPRSLPASLASSMGHPTCVFCFNGGLTDLEEWGGHIPLRPAQLQPSGWTACSVSLTHCEAGGATTGRWSLMAWYPPGHPAAKPAPIAPQPWFPIRVFVNDWAAATTVPVVAVPEDLPPTPSVVCSGGTPGVRGAPPGGISINGACSRLLISVQGSSWPHQVAHLAGGYGLFPGWNWPHCGMSRFWSRTPLQRSPPSPFFGDVVLPLPQRCFLQARTRF